MPRSFYQGLLLRIFTQVFLSRTFDTVVLFGVVVVLVKSTGCKNFKTELPGSLPIAALTPQAGHSSKGWAGRPLNNSLAMSQKQWSSRHSWLALQCLYSLFRRNSDLTNFFSTLNYIHPCTSYHQIYQRSLLHSQQHPRRHPKTTTASPATFSASLHTAEVLMIYTVQSKFMSTTNLL